MTRNSILIAAGVILVALFGYFVFGRDTEVLNSENGGNGAVIAFGDSLVVGQGATAGNDFVSVLSRRIGKPIKNLGVNGDTTELALKRVGDVLSEKPGVVLVLLGGNDYLRKIPRETTFKNLSDIVRKIQDAGAVVVVLGVRGGLLRDSYENDFEEFAEEHGAAYVSNVLDGLYGNPKFMSDAIHPNDNGYAIIASKILPVLNKYIK